MAASVGGTGCEGCEDCESWEGSECGKDICFKGGIAGPINSVSSLVCGCEGSGSCEGCGGCEGGCGGSCFEGGIAGPINSAAVSLVISGGGSCGICGWAG